MPINKMLSQGVYANFFPGQYWTLSVVTDLLPQLSLVQPGRELLFDFHAILNPITWIEDDLFALFESIQHFGFIVIAMSKFNEG